MKKLIFAAAAVVGLTFVAGNTAEAGHGRRSLNFGFSNGRFGFNIHGGHRGHRRHFGQPYYPGGWYHDTGHYDYHPPSVQWHGDHFDYVPGHYDYHNTGHWHPY